MAAYYTFEDLSGSTTPSNPDNPYEGLIEACNNNAVGAMLLSSTYCSADRDFPADTNTSPVQRSQDHPQYPTTSETSRPRLSRCDRR